MGYSVVGPVVSGRALCLCDCGRRRLVSITRGEPRCSSCRACSNADKAKIGAAARTAAVTRHAHWVGGKPSPTYKAWESMCQRCYNPRHASFPAYGATGIAVAGAWRGPGGFDVFLAEVGERPSDQHSLDRYPDGRGNYEPGNVRWATRREQAQNKPGFNVRYTIGSETLVCAEWCRRYGISQQCVRQRILRGWSPQQAILTPVRGGRENG